MFDFKNLIERKDELDRLYAHISRQFSEDPVFLEKLSKEYSILMKIISAAQENPVLQEVAETAGTSIDSVRRWARGKFPSTYAYALKRKINLETLKHMENFIFLLGVYQSQKLTGTEITTFTISARDKILNPTLETCINSCFGSKPREKEGCIKVYSTPLMTMIKKLTNDNTTIPAELLITENKRDIYYSGFLTSVKANLEPFKYARRNIYKLYASLIRTRGDIINSVHEYLCERKIKHTYYEKKSRIRFRRKQCIALLDLLPNCTTKETIQKKRKYV